MKKPFTVRVQTLALVIAIIALLVGCVDPQRETINILSKQGLVAVLPARDYIKPGGLVVLPPHSHPAYIDPLDDVPPTSVSDFKAILPAQSFKDSTSLEAGLKAISSLLPLSLQAKSSGSVKFGQIDTEGTRLESPKIDAIIQAPNTKAKALDQIHGNGNRVFVVQDVYAGKTLNVASTSTKSLDVSYGDGNTKPPDCSLGTDTQKPGSTDTGGAKPASPGEQAKTPNNQAKPATEQAKPAKPAKPAAPSKPTSQQGQAAVANPSSLSASVGVCHATDGSLSFTSSSPIAFAVRLNELQNDHGVLKVKYGDLHFTYSLGDPDLEKRTSIIKASDPIIHGLERLPR